MLARIDDDRLKEQTLTMPLTTLLNILRGWRYTLLIVSNWVIVVSAMSTASTAVLAEQEMDLAFEIFFSVS